MSYTERQKEIINKAISQQVKLIKKTVKQQKKRL